MMDLFNYLGISMPVVCKAAICSAWLSATLTFMIAFTITPDASFRCWLGFLRLWQRVAMCGLSIAFAYLAASLMEGRDPVIPSFTIVVAYMLAVVPSAIRHLSAPGVPSHNTWAGAWRIVMAELHQQQKPVRPVMQSGAGPKPLHH